MPAHVMVPLDGSAFAEQALPHALSICQRGNARLHPVFVRATLPLQPHIGDGGAYLEELAARLDAVLPGRVSPALLTDESGPLAYPPPAVPAVARTLAAHAAAIGADLVIMTTHGLGGIARAWLGSVADSLLRIAPCPVLMIRPATPAPAVAMRAADAMTHIVVPLDGSEEAERALPVASGLAGLFGARMSLVRAVSVLSWEITTDAWTPTVARGVVPLSRDAALKYLERVAETVRSARIDVAVYVLDVVYPATGIVQFAERSNADMIVMTTTGAGRIRRLLLGSVADRIIRSGALPVLVLNTRSAASGPQDRRDVEEAVTA